MSSNILKADNGVSSGTTGLVYTAGNDGTLQLATTTSGGTATTAVTINTSQQVGIGTTSPSYKLDVSTSPSSASYDGTNIKNGANSTVIGCYLTGSSYSFRGIGASQSWLYSNVGNFNMMSDGGAITFSTGTNSGVQATIDTSGNLLIGTTSAGIVNSNGITLNPLGNYSSFNHASGTVSGIGYIAFGYNTSLIGSITQNGTTGVLYNVTSDYRLKNNPVPVTGAKDFVMALQPKTWDWWDGSGKGVGFIAHEFMEVAKYSGHGEKDATKQEEYEVTPAVKDEQGNITTPAVMGTRTVPVYQSIQSSSSEVMANLVAYIQELSAEVTALKAKVGV